MAKPIATNRQNYALKVLFISLLFVPLDMVVLILLGYQLTWQMVGIVAGVMLFAAVVLIATTGRPSKKPPTTPKQS